MEFGIVWGTESEVPFVEGVGNSKNSVRGRSYHSVKAISDISRVLVFMELSPI